MRKLIKKLNNFRFTSLLLCIIQVINVVACVLCLVAYQTAGKYDENRVIVTPAFDENPVIGETSPVVGMIYFVTCIASLLLSCFIAYKLFPYVLNKKKLQPTKAFPICAVINAVLSFIVLALTILLLATEDVANRTTFIASLIIFIVSTIGNGLTLFPLLKCEFYQPEFKIE